MAQKIFLLLLISFCSFYSYGQKVFSITVDGSINPASASFIERAIDEAAAGKAICILLHLNTPGGLLKSTRVIVSKILKSPIPVIVYVSPGGAQAGSAGVFITLAANLAVMAPGTNIGAAHPVNLQGGMDSIMGTKVTNDAAAFIRTIALVRNRNMEWADSAVRNSISITAAEALENKVIDLIADNDLDLLDKVDGRTIEMESGDQVLHTSGKEVEVLQMTLLEKFLNLISDPNIAYILMMIGFYGLLFELYSPGTIFPGIVGIISLILAFYTMHTLSVNYAGLALIIFGIILFLLEIKITSHGLLAIGGVISLLLGSFMLLPATNPLENLKISKTVIILFSAFTALFFLFIVGMAVKAQKHKPSMGIEALRGEIGEALEDLCPGGTVRMKGEVWKAESISGNINKGQKVRIKEIDSFTLLVEQA